MKRPRRRELLRWVGSLAAAFISQVTLAADPVQEAVVQVLEAYEAAWSRHDAAAIASLYHEPALRVSPEGPRIRADRAEQENFFRGLLAALVAQGYDHSVWERLEVRVLDARTAMAFGVVRRERVDGTLFQRQGVTYGLWRTTEAWRIFMTATHPVPAIGPGSTQVPDPQH